MCNKKMTYTEFVRIHKYLFQKEFDDNNFEIKPKWYDTEEEYQDRVDMQSQICRDIRDREQHFMKQSKKLYRQFCQGRYEI